MKTYDANALVNATRYVMPGEIASYERLIFRVKDEIGLSQTFIRLYR